MNAVLELADVTVKRGQATLLDGVDWVVEEDERWVILGPNGAGKTTLMQLCSAQIHPDLGSGRASSARSSAPSTSSSSVPASAGPAPPWPSGSLGTSSCATWWSRRRTAWSAAGASSTTSSTTSAPRALLKRGRRRRPAGPHLRHAQRGGAQAGPDRPSPDDRPGAAASSTSRLPASTSAAARTWSHAVRARARRVRARDHPGLPPRRGDPAGLHPRAAAARGTGRGGRPAARGDDRGSSPRTFGMRLALDEADGRYTARRIASQPERCEPLDRLAPWTG